MIAQERKPTKRIFTPSTFPVYRRLLGYVRPHIKILSISIVSMIVFGATDSAIPFILKYVLDGIFGKQDTEMLWVLVGAICALTVVRAIFGFLQRYLSVVVGLRIVEDLRNHIATHLLTLPTAFFVSKSTGSLLSSMTNDTLLIRRALTDAVVTLIRDTIRVISLVTTAIILDPVLGSIAFIAFPAAIIPIAAFGKKVRKLSRSGQDQLGGLTSVLHENIVGHRVVQSFGMEAHEKQRFADENRRSTVSFIKAAKYGALSGPINEIFASIAIAVIIVYGGLSVIHGVRTQGDFIAFITAILLMYEPLKNSGKISSTIQQGVAAAERVFEIIDTKPSIVDGGVVLDSQNPTIRYSAVSFRYPEQNGFALDSITLSVAAGSTLALVGPSGGGKTSLATLLSRFYDVSAGSISIDGRDIREYTLSSLRQHISIVDQHTFLFDDTLFNNIAYGRPSATREEVLAAAKAANATNFIEALPNSFDTMIGEQGLRLSGGQRARIAIARALLKNAPILVLDEATASLDSESEVAVQNAIERLMKGRTVIVIAHRLSTIRQADAIAVLKAGTLVEIGTHEELLARGQEYAKLYNIQFSSEVAA